MRGGSGQLGKNVSPNIAENQQKGRKKWDQCGQIWGSLYKMMKVVWVRATFSHSCDMLIIARR